MEKYDPMSGEMCRILNKRGEVRTDERGVKLTCLPFIVKALIAALKEHPMLNATQVEEEDEIIVKKYYNIGIAVDEPDGLIVPVIKLAEHKSLFQIAGEIQSLAQRAKERSRGGTIHE